MLWRRLGETAPSPVAEFVRAGDAQSRELLGAIFGCSPFLTACALAEPETVRQVMEGGPDAAFGILLDDLRALELVERTRLMAGLRGLRRRWALLIALADLAGHWGLEQVTAALSTVADLAVAKVTGHLLLELCRRGEIELACRDDPGRGSGMIVLALGKHGARELNYSSDVDLILLFDEERFRPQGAEPAMAHAVRLARSLAYLLETKTADGYVFRADLRLRPHLPGHPLALSTEAALIYYERHGQNWERAALIKARAVGGDLDAGQRFLAELVPFIWRKHLDYAAIRDIHAIKRQINTYRGFRDITVPGHDLKIGRGGIREIEFFAQVQQLILGGRLAELRVPATCPALERLADSRWIEPETAAELTRAYRFLRALEHRLQMVADRQTQALPERDAELASIAAFAGFASRHDLEAAVLETLRLVERHYAALFEREPDLGGAGSLVFTGTADDPATLATLAGMGLREPVPVSARIRAWHHGHIRATRSTRARELLTELTPALLRALEAQPDPDAAFRLFDEFLTSLPSGVQIFSLLRANPRLLALLADVMGMAPRLARLLAKRAELLEALLTPDFFEALPEREGLRQELGSRLRDARDLEDTLGYARRWAHGRQFQAGLQVLLGLVDAARAGLVLTAIAEVVLERLLTTAEGWLVAQHGRVEGGSFVVLALGKLGSRELTVGSDLDLVFVYEAAADARSDGARPLPAATWFARLGQRLVSVLAAPTAEGALYQIDTRLRPSGNVGPVACSLENLGRYHERTAEIWEQQALTRARVVAGDVVLGAKVEAVIAATVSRARDHRALGHAVRAMRERIFKEHGTSHPWALKHTRGGMVEVEFLAQYLALASRDAALVAQSPGAVFAAAAARGLLDPGDAVALAAAASLYQSLQAVLRLSVESRLEPGRSPPRLLEALRRAASLVAGIGPFPDFAALETQLIESQDRVRHLFGALCPAPDAPGQPGETA